MLTITRKRERITTTEYSRNFDWRGHTGWGFGFSSDADGNVDESKLAPEGLANYRACLNGTHDVVDRGVQVYTHSYTHPAEGRCVCRRLVVLDEDTRGEGIDCECGRIYNGVGQELAPRAQWEER